jgi:hypothetical protein
MVHSTFQRIIPALFVGLWLTGVPALAATPGIRDDGDFFKKETTGRADKIIA